MRLEDITNQRYIERFWSKVEKTDGCWVWKAARMIRADGSIGYGRLGFRRDPTISAHRYAWAITHGRLPGKLCVCHTCDNPLCVRPDHLWLVTQAENMADMRRKGRR